MIVLIDNYDSFTYNLFQMIATPEPDIKVFRNDAVTAAEISAMDPEAVILSPGPGRPEDAGISMELVKTLGKTVPLLGVSLGHEAVCAAYGAEITYAKQLMHGKQSETCFDLSCPVFKGLPEHAPVARYHSLAVSEETLPGCFRVTARSSDGEIMAVQHTEHPVFGLQFQPESIMTPDGKTILENFVGFAKQFRQA